MSDHLTHLNCFLLYFDWIDSFCRESLCRATAWGVKLMASWAAEKPFQNDTWTFWGRKTTPTLFKWLIRAVLKGETSWRIHGNLSDMLYRIGCNVSCIWCVSNKRYILCIEKYKCCFLINLKKERLAHLSCFNAFHCFFEPHKCEKEACQNVHSWSLVTFFW